MKNKLLNHTEVGSVIHTDLQSEGSFADVLVKRSSEEDSPLIVGQFISILSQGNEKKVFLAKVTSFMPDQGDQLSIKGALKSSQSHNVKLDDLYKETTLFLIYKVKILGICEDDGNMKFYSNIREIPSVTALSVCIPSGDFMERLFKSAVKESEDGRSAAFEIGTLKYGTFGDYTEKYYPSSKPVPVQFNAANLLRKRTGIFGKSGYGKSNTVKTVIGMMATKFPDCGQLIFDTNGEYAMENDQNDGFMDIFSEAGIKGKVVLYSSRKIHPSKKEKHGEESFKMLKFDVFENITSSMDIVENSLNGQNPPMYLQSWLNEVKGVDDQLELFSNVSNKGIVWGIWFKVCLDAGMVPLNERTSITTLSVKKEFLNDLVSYLNEEELAEEGSAEELTRSSFTNLSQSEQDKILKEYDIFENSGRYFTKNIKTMAEYGNWYAESIKEKEKDRKKGEGSIFSSSKDSSIKGYIELLSYYRRLYQLKTYNIGQMAAEDRKNAKSISLGESVWKDLLEKKIVIIDLASVPSSVSKSLAEQIATSLLKKASDMFGDSEQQDIFKNFDVLCFIEEAQNYLSKEQIRDGSGIYERLAKEGRKFHIGLVYVTQQPSAIDEKITSQTENIVAMHMSNYADTRMLHDIKDKFDEITCKFLKDEAQKGLAYLYAEPHQPFVLPAQIHLFDKNLILKNLKKN